MILTQARLKELLHYDQDAGVFTWLESRGGVKSGDMAGWTDRRGYLRISIDGVLYPAGQLAWLYMTGGWPKQQIDHRNLISSDNRWCNLRDVSASENMRNQNIKSTNTSGFKGVSARKNTFRAQCKLNGKAVHIGNFKTAQEASEAYQDFNKRIVYEKAGSK